MSQVMVDVDTTRVRVLAAAFRTMGPRSANSVRVVSTLYDMNTLRRVNSKQIDGVIQICASLDLATAEREAHKQSFLWAWDELLTQSERNIILSDFAPGSHMNWMVSDAIGPDAGKRAECVNPKMAAAHAYSMFMRNEMVVSDLRPKGVFQKVGDALRTANVWFWGLVERQRSSDSVQGLFDELSSGAWRSRLPVADAAADLELAASTAPRPN